MVGFQRSVDRWPAQLQGSGHFAYRRAGLVQPLNRSLLLVRQPHSRTRFAAAYSLASRFSSGLAGSHALGAQFRLKLCYTR